MSWQDHAGGSHQAGWRLLVSLQDRAAATWVRCCNNGALTTLGSAVSLPQDAHNCQQQLAQLQQRMEAAGRKVRDLHQQRQELADKVGGITPSPAVLGRRAVRRPRGACCAPCSGGVLCAVLGRRAVRRPRGACACATAHPLPQNQHWSVDEAPLTRSRCTVLPPPPPPPPTHPPPLAPWCLQQNKLDLRKQALNAEVHRSHQK